MLKRLIIKYLLEAFGLLMLLIFPFEIAFSQLNPINVGELFRDDVVPRIDITIDVEMFNKLLGEINQDTEYPATFRFNNSFIDEEFDSVGFRLRGNVSRQAPKKSFKVSVNTFKKGRKFFGVEDINLIANSTDPLMVRPRLAYYLAREIGITALNTNYTRLYVNNIFQGIYILSEQIDEIFLKKRFGNGNGNLYKCRAGASLESLGDNQEDYKVTEVLFDRTLRRYDLQTNTTKDDYTDLLQFIKVVNTTNPLSFKDSIDNYFNVRSYLKTLAFEVFIGHWDSYMTYAQNYMLYHNSESNRFEYITYDTDLTFGIMFGGDITTADIYSPVSYLNNRPLINNLLAIKEYRDMYTFYHRQLLAMFSQDKIRAIADSLRHEIQPYIFDDPYYNSSFSKNDFENNMDTPVGIDSYGLMNFIKVRMESTHSQLDNSNTVPIISGFTSNEIGTADTLKISCIVENENEKLEVKLFYRFDDGDSNSIKMVLASDRSIPFTQQCMVKLNPFNRAGILKIRIAATDEKGNTSFYPTRGEYSKTIYNNHPGLKINEILAKNQYSITDEFGEHDDWVEVVNNDTISVSTGNCYLSDNRTDLGKWQLPDTTLKPTALIYIWADKDKKQGVFHTNFKLSGEGETIFLSSLNKGVYQLIDSMQYPLQLTDISYGPAIEGSKANNFLQHITPGYTNATKGLAFAIWNVDMKRQVKDNRFIIDKDPVDVVGNFNNWKNTVSFCDPDKDTIYTQTVMGLHANDAIEYRFRMRHNNNYIEFKETPGQEMNRKAFLLEGCNTFNVIFNEGNTSINSFYPNDILEIYPNPVKNQLFIKASNIPVKILILNPMGQKMIEFDVINQLPETLDVSAFPPGIYLVKAFIGHNLTTLKLIKSIN